MFLGPFESLKIFSQFWIFVWEKEELFCVYRFWLNMYTFHRVRCVLICFLLSIYRYVYEKYTMKAEFDLYPIHLLVEQNRNFGNFFSGVSQCTFSGVSQCTGQELGPKKNLTIFLIIPEVCMRGIQPDIFLIEQYD